MGRRRLMVALSLLGGACLGCTSETDLPSASTSEFSRSASVDPTMFPESRLSVRGDDAGCYEFTDRAGTSMTSQCLGGFDLMRESDLAFVLSSKLGDSAVFIFVTGFGVDLVGVTGVDVRLHFDEPWLLVEFPTDSPAPELLLRDDSGNEVVCGVNIGPTCSAQ